MQSKSKSDADEIKTHMFIVLDTARSSLIHKFDLSMFVPASQICDIAVHKGQRMKQSVSRYL
jgi:hypothetical protein